MIGVTISHYKILEKLGEGGMGVVYKAEDVKLDRFVAIKILPPHLSTDEEAVRRFVHEAKTASALDHAYIGTIHEVDETPDGRTFIVMAYYEGETLRERIDRRDVSLEEAMELTTQVTLGLSKAHAKGIIHRDIKPSNVIITADGEAKLVDFGLAKLAGATKLTRTGSTMGTVAYMSPEQARGDEVDARSDIWSLGVMLYEMLTGRQPFRGDYEPAVVYSIMNEEPDAVSATRRDVPVEIENIVDMAITKDLSQRYQTVEEFLAALEEQREELKLGPRGRGLLTMRRKVRQRLIRISIPAVLIVAAIILIIVFQPFEIEIRPKTKEAIARENSIVVMPFENVMDPNDDEKQAAMITSLLIGALQESEYMQVIKEERLYDVLRQLDKEDERILSREVAEQVAELTGSNWILKGKLIQSEPNLVVSAEITNAVTGDIRGRPATVRGNVGETIFGVVDRLKTDLGIELALPPEALEELGRSVREAATDSPEAYRYYVEATHKSYKSFYWRDAIVGYERAVSLDSTFAMAYLQLATLHFTICANTGICHWPEINNNLIKAKEYSGKLTELQKLELEAIDAFIVSDYKRAHRAYMELIKRDPQNKRMWSEAGDIMRVFFAQPDSALSYYDKTIELDSTFALAYGWKALCYIILEDFEKAEEYADTYLNLAPNEPQANWVYAQLQASQGNIDKMIEYLEKAESIKPGQESEALAAANIIGRRYEQADSIFSAYITGTDADARKVYRRKIASIPMYQGKLDHALSVLDDGIAADRVEKQSDPYKQHIKGRIYMHKNSMAEALKEFETVNDLSNNDSYNYAHYIYALSLNGRTAEAEDSLGVFRTRLDMSIPWDLGLYQWSTGMIKMAKGDVDSAIVYLGRAADTFHRRTQQHAIIPRIYHAKAYLEFGQPADAAREIEIALRLKNVANVIHAIWAAKIHYLAGMIYEEIGNNEVAIAQYEEFLEIWKDADPDLEEVPDARRRLALLKEKQ